ncbi:tetratricopeptide repeat protein [Montanilutibacter psychrotolerans]|uniref:Cytochrome C biogenesis protein n=1 Tax=Montanilutibacter psychrotolerans TaxID=1327343 RepID=A0A3M8SR12_9GAMM|nr:tetratricopeptide repeat protein [Lysobacter psychrotolerans]RNF83145.1 cytochrome C biogenesis protein [Lysobacter psychrotolerans]
MTAFVFASALLVLVVLAFVLRPLWQARPLAGAGISIAIAVVVGLLYVVVGTPRALDPAQREPIDRIADAIPMLQAELARDPSQLEGWRLLARAQADAGRLPEARDAFARAARLAPDDADVLVEAAESRAVANPARVFDAQALALLHRALKLQPMHQRGRWFLGIAQRQAKQPAEAAKTWEPLLAMVDERTGASLRAQIDDARADAGLPPLPAAPVEPAAPVGRSIAVSVSLDPRLAMGLPPDAVVFVIARQPGMRMPAAAKKLPAASLPQVVNLDDRDSPMPTLKLSQLQDIEISARISASGDATPRKGDFQATPAVITHDQQAAAVLIDRVVE